LSKGLPPKEWFDRTVLSEAEGLTTNGTSPSEFRDEDLVIGGAYPYAE